MPRPTNKKELLEQSAMQFDKLQNLIENISKEQQEIPFCFAVTEKDKEDHWNWDKNLRDVLIHLYEWHQLIINFIKNNQNSDTAIPFSPQPYTWKSYGGMNVGFWKKHQTTNLENAKELLQKSHDDVLFIIEGFSNQELFTKEYFGWSGTTIVVAFCVSATSSHYDWAMKKIKRQIKSIREGLNFMNWEPWTGCYPESTGCDNCYFYGPNAKRFGQNVITKTDKFDWPIRRNKKGKYNIKGDKILATCFATDFFLPEADEWRGEAWAMIKERQDIDFLILTKRIDRFMVSLPYDWGDGYDNVNIGCTVENQRMADYRLPLFLSYPIKRRFIAVSPILEKVDLIKYLHNVDHVTVSGENGRDVRVCDYEWVLNIKNQCEEAGKTFWFKSTGTYFKRDGAVEKINPFKQGSLAKEMSIDISDGKSLF